MSTKKTELEKVKGKHYDMNGDEERKYSFRTIAVDNIHENGNIRQVGDIDDLAASIRAHGIINPITVTNDFGMPTQYRVVAGHRRLAAAKRIGLANVRRGYTPSAGWTRIPRVSTKSRSPRTSHAWT